MNDTSYEKALINRTFINAPIETVWSTLVATDKSLPFFFGSVCQTKNGLVKGEKMRMVHPNGKVAMVVGEVLEFDPPHCYSHTFQMTNIDEPGCKVTYRLSKKDDGTEFELTIEIKSIVETGSPAFSGKMVGLLSPVFGVFAKKSQRIEHWPIA